MTESTKPTESFKDLPIKHQIIATLADNGVRTTDIAKGLNMHRNHVSMVKQKIRKNSLTAPALVKKSIRATKRILDGKTWGEIKDIKASDVMSAVKEVQDRVDPKVKQNMNMNINVDIDPVTAEELKRAQNW